MGAYDDKRNALSHTPIWYIVMTLDTCTRTFGTSPCLATGAKCYNTFATCKYRSVFNKTTTDYEYSSLGAPLPFIGPRPYIKSVSLMPTEIKDAYNAEGKFSAPSLTSVGRVKIKMADEPELTDVGLDLYRSSRSNFQGSYWRKWVERNKFYFGRRIEIYEGFEGLAKADFVKRFVGTLSNFTLDNQGEVTIEAVDLVKSLDNVNTPIRVDCKLAAAIDSDDTVATLSKVVDFPSSGYVLMDNEIIQYGGVNTTTKQITGLTRARGGTTAAAHAVNAKVGLVIYLSGDPYDIMVDLLTNKGGIATADVDTATFTALKTYPIDDINVAAWITEPTKVRDLYFELIDLLDCASWQGEDLKVTIAKNMPNKPGRIYKIITDAASVILKTSSVDLNEKARFTRVFLLWDKTVLGKPAELSSYNRGELAVDADLEGANGLNEVREKVVPCRWVNILLDQEETLTKWLVDTALRMLIQGGSSRPIIKADVSMKDADIKTGDYVKATTDELLTPAGVELTNAIFRVIKREVKDSRVSLLLQRVGNKRIAFYAPDGTPTYENATEAEREYGFYSDDNYKLPNGDDAYVYY